MSQISKCPKLRVVLGYWEALGEVSELRYKNLLYSSSKRSYCSYCFFVENFMERFFPAMLNICSDLFPQHCPAFQPKPRIRGSSHLLSIEWILVCGSSARKIHRRMFLSSSPLGFYSFPRFRVSFGIFQFYSVSRFLGAVW